MQVVSTLKGIHSAEAADLTTWTIPWVELRNSCTNTINQSRETKWKCSSLQEHNHYGDRMDVVVRIPLSANKNKTALIKLHYQTTPYKIVHSSKKKKKKRVLPCVIRIQKFSCVSSCASKNTNLFLTFYLCLFFYVFNHLKLEEQDCDIRVCYPGEKDTRIHIYELSTNLCSMF